MTKHLLINDENIKTDGFVQEAQLYEYTIKCWCGNTWEWVSREPRSARCIVDMAADEYWTLDDDNHPRCPQCVRKIKIGQQPKDPDNLGKNQRSVLQAIREHGSWHKHMCGWLWDTTSNTKKILDTLVKRGLVQVDEKGTYTPV